MILGREITTVEDTLDPAGERVLAIAAGGGGGGAGTFLAKGRAGGEGRDAISTQTSEASVKYENGHGTTGSKGGNADGMGSGGTGLNDGSAGVGGKGGSNDGVESTWGIEVEWSSGKGGRAKSSRGGSGGGGYGGGGAGNQCVAPSASALARMHRRIGLPRACDFAGVEAL